MNSRCQVIGDVIRELRLQRKMSQEVVSGLAGMARSHLAMIENGRKNLSIDSLWRIAQALDICLSELIEKAEKRLPKQ